MNKIKIKNLNLPQIVAEAGINHNGSLKNAFKMIEIAKNSGATAIKFQTFKAKEFIADNSLMYSYFSKGKKITKSQMELFKKCEFSKEEWLKISKKCNDEKIMFLSTPENKSDLDLLVELKVKAIKVSSDEIINLPFLNEISKTKLPIIVSSGMSNLKEIDNALKTIGTFNGYPTILLVTTSEYPTPLNHVNLRKFEMFKEKFPFLPLGISDHTQGHLTAAMACVYGSVFFEKHFTISHNLTGPDHWFSENPKGLKEWINAIQNAHIILGSKIVKPTKIELKNKNDFRRKIVAIKSIKKGEVFDLEKIGLRRTNHRMGLDPYFLKKILNKKSKINYQKGQLIKL